MEVTTATRSPIERNAALVREPDTGSTNPFTPLSAAQSQQRKVSLEGLLQLVERSAQQAQRGIERMNQLMQKTQATEAGEPYERHLKAAKILLQELGLSGEALDAALDLCKSILRRCGNAADLTKVLNEFKKDSARRGKPGQILTDLTQIEDWCRQHPGQSIPASLCIRTNSSSPK